MGFVFSLKLWITLKDSVKLCRICNLILAWLMNAAVLDVKLVKFFGFLGSWGWSWVHKIYWRYPPNAMGSGEAMCGLGQPVQNFRKIIELPLWPVYKIIIICTFIYNSNHSIIYNIAILPACIYQLRKRGFCLLNKKGPFIWINWKGGQGGTSFFKVAE